MERNHALIWSVLLLSLLCIETSAAAEPQAEEPVVAQGEQAGAAGGPQSGAARSRSAWSYHVALGAQFLPDYDEEGRSSGLSEQEFFAQIIADGRFGSDCPPPEVRLTHCGLSAPWHLGVNLTLAGMPVVRGDQPQFSPDEFNDVAQSIIASQYVYWPMLQALEHADDPKTALVHNFGPIVRVGAISRESLEPNGDSVNWHYSVGAQYTYEGYRHRGAYNDIPSGYLRISAARFEDYAGLGKSSRVVTEGGLEVVSKLNLYLGLYGNFGSGPDEIALVFSFVRRPSQLASLFSGLMGGEEGQ